MLGRLFRSTALVIPGLGFEPIPSNTFIEFLDYLKAAGAGRLWVQRPDRSPRISAPKILETAQPQVANGKMSFTWQVPAPFPHGVVLRVAVNGSTNACLF